MSVHPFARAVDDDVRDPSDCPACGSDSCDDPAHAWYAPLGTTENARPSAGLHFRSADDVIATPPPDDVIAGLAFAGRITVLVAESGGGKTFVALDAAAAVSEGAVWHGRRTECGSVAYLSFEADALGGRLLALREHAGRALDHLHILHASDVLSPAVDRQHAETPSRGELTARAALADLQTRLAATGHPPITLIVIDTLRASLSGSEDSSENASAYLRAVRRLLAAVPTAGAMLIHHSGWLDGDGPRKRERGSSSWRGNADATVYLETGEYDATRGEASLTLKTLKVRDCERPADLALLRRRVVTSARHPVTHEPVTSCIIVGDPRSREDREAECARAEQAASSDLDRQILGLIHTTSITSTADISTRLRRQKQTVTDAVTRLASRGWIVRLKKGDPFTLTTDGLTQIEGL